MNDTENKPQPAPETLSRRLIRACDRAVLSTAMPDGAWPYGSLVMTACDHAANPLLLISDLAEHTTNLSHDNRASLLFDGTAGLDSPLTGARVTVLGTISKTEDPGLIARYTARHPESEMFAGFADFNFYKMTVERAHIVAGFGVIHWIDHGDLLFDTSGFEDLAAADSLLSAPKDDVRAALLNTIAQFLPAICRMIVIGGLLRRSLQVNAP